MKKPTRKPRPASEPTERTGNRKLRPRATPKWLMTPGDLDAMAQRRCLLLLSALSGEKPVTQVVTEMQISRGTYYQLETKALNAMLAALTPGVTDEESPQAGLTARIASLEEQVKRLTQEKRRAERLLFLTRKVVKPGPMKTAPGRPLGSKNRPRATTSKATSLSTSGASPPTSGGTSPSSPPAASPSTPAPTSAAAR